MTSPEPQVFVVDDDPSVQRSIGRLLRREGLSARTFSSPKDFLDGKVPAGATGCVVLDVRMPGMSGLDLQEELQRRGVRLPIVFITGHGTIPLSVRAMKRGALDFLEKPFNSKTLIEVIRKAIGRSQEAAAEEHERRNLEKKFESLAPRQREVFRRVVAGMLNKQIAFELGIAEKTVKIHRARVMKKMQAKSLAELMHLAERLKLPFPSR
jgi:RNA polymerase sigma factor (sigma-70 family)